jgi:hypothetical protein
MSEHTHDNGANDACRCYADGWRRAWKVIEAQHAAAPALLAALEEALWWLSNGAEGRTRIRTDALLPAIRAAIKEARPDA